MGIVMCSEMYKCGKPFIFMLCKYVSGCGVFCCVRLLSWPCSVRYQTLLISLSARYQAEFFQPADDLSKWRDFGQILQTPPS
jgi:hypothetical protein